MHVNGKMILCAFFCYFNSCSLFEKEIYHIKEITSYLIIVSIHFTTMNIVSLVKMFILLCCYYDKHKIISNVMYHSYKYYAVHTLSFEHFTVTTILSNRPK